MQFATKFSSFTRVYDGIHTKHLQCTRKKKKNIKDASQILTR